MQTQPIEAMLAEHAMSLLRPLTEAATSAPARQRLWSGIGWTPAALAGADPEELVEAFQVCRTTVAELAERLAEGIDTLGDAVACLDKVRAAVTAVSGVVDGWRPPSTDPAPYRLLLADLFAHLLDAHLAIRAPRLLVFCDVVGVRRLVTSAPLEVGGVLARDGRARPVYDLAPLAALLRDPVGAVRERVFGQAVPPALPDALADALGPLLAGWLSDIGVLAAYGTPGADSPESGLTEAERAAAAHLLHVAWSGDYGAVDAGFRLAAGLIRDVSPGGTDGPLAAVLAPRGELHAALDDGVWRVDATLAGSTRPVIVSRNGARFEPPDQAGSLRGEVVLRYGDAEAGVPILRFGSADAIRLEIAEIRLSGTALVDADGPTGGLAAQLVGARLVLEPGADGFLAAVLPKQPVVVDLDLGLAWSPSTGLTLAGAARLDQTFPVGRTLGPLTVQQVRVVLGSTADGAVQLLLTADVTVRLGPVTASVADLGLRAALRPAAEPGAFGPFDFALEPVTPKGVGIAVNASVVTGGGYLFADPDTGDYGGAIELKFASLQLSAIGLLSTRMPDGSPGFSLLVLISARFPRYSSASASRSPASAA
ncbi:hypothetical protein Pflav_021540 [Phytohabitans flavus]|uniref:DUF6603 domain-containing protein n=1 Tax=Phytohabitans flavus TaxID=1076124 RepID=A0A6F8XPI3_9ACTN|nr:DUF6603 domain-containing protein [Phytohabitans flavus]BCB75744.1 hypothetical protein Pflav_021540 [Phytohabitans flavus]